MYVIANVQNTHDHKGLVLIQTLSRTYADTVTYARMKGRQNIFVKRIMNSFVFEMNLFVVDKQRGNKTIRNNRHNRKDFNFACVLLLVQSRATGSGLNVARKSTICCFDKTQ